MKTELHEWMPLIGVTAFASAIAVHGQLDQYWFSASPIRTVT